MRRQQAKIMNAQNEEDFVFACLLGAYIQSLRQQEEGQQQLQSGKVRVQQAGRRRIRRKDPCGFRERLSEDRRQQMSHYSTVLTREPRTKNVKAFQNNLRMAPDLFDETLERATPAIE